MSSVKPTISRILVIAGSDSGGGAGIQADIKTIMALGGYAATAITALTAQNTQGVFGVHAVPAAFVEQQIKLALDDIGADAFKTGMLHNADVIQVVADILAEVPHIPLVLDPVMIAKGGAPLLAPEAISVLIERLIPRATILTPNIPEAEFLLEHLGKGQGHIHTPAQQEAAALQLLDATRAGAVLIKGGHAEGEVITDVLAERGKAVQHFVSPRIHTSHTHGTGCTLASAIATGIAQGMPLSEAVTRARDYVMQAIANAPGLGSGHGPLGHRII